MLLCFLVGYTDTTCLRLFVILDLIFLIQLFLLECIISFVIFWYMLVCSMYILWPKPWKVPAVVDSIVVVGALTCCALFHSPCVIWKPHRWTCNVVWFRNLHFTCLNWAIIPYKQLKTFTVWKVTGNLIIVQ